VTLVLFSKSVLTNIYLSAINRTVVKNEGGSGENEMYNYRGYRGNSIDDVWSQIYKDLDKSLAEYRSFTEERRQRIWDAVERANKVESNDTGPSPD
jgi:hypothetical protein